jgi:hypothetical protein
MRKLTKLLLAVILPVMLVLNSTPVLAYTVPVPDTFNATYVTDTGANLNGAVTDMGGYASLDVGFAIYNLDNDPMTFDVYMVAPITVAGNFTAPLRDLITDTNYVYFTIIINPGGSDPWADFFNQKTFKTTSQSGGMSVRSGGSYQVGSSVTITGSLDSLGNSTTAITSFDFGYNMLGYPYNFNSTNSPMNTTGTFTYTLPGLLGNNTYYWRAKGVGDNGQTVYGDDEYFLVQNPDVQPTVITDYADSVTSSSVRLHGNITSMGNKTFAFAAFEFWTGNNTPSSINAYPVNTAGNFNTTLSSLMANTTYNYRAYVMTDTNTYGITRTFKTLPSGGSGLAFIPVTGTFSLSVPTATAVTNTTATITGQLASYSQMRDVTAWLSYQQYYPGNLTAIGSPTNTTTTLIQPTLVDTEYKTLWVTGQFGASVTALTPDSLYKVTAHAYDKDPWTGAPIHETIQSESIFFTTLATGGTPIPPDMNIPTITTGGYTFLSSNSVRLTGTVNSMGNTTVNFLYFQVGTSPSGYSINPTAHEIRAIGAVTETITALAANTTYYYRIYLAGANHLTVYGEERSFVTGTAGGVIPPPGTATPAPTLPGGGRGSVGPFTLPDDWVTSGTSYIWLVLLLVAIPFLMIYLFEAVKLAKAGAVIGAIADIGVFIYWVAGGWVNVIVLILLLIVVIYLLWRTAFSARGSV